MPEESVFTENKIARTRDFATVTGFMIIFIYTSVLAACLVKDIKIMDLYGENRLFLTLVPFLILVFSAGIIAWTKDRFLMAAMFIMFGYGILAPMFPVVIYGESDMGTLTVGIVMIIFALSLIAARKKQEFLCSIILILMGVACIIYEYWYQISGAKEICECICGAIAVIAAYCIISFSIGNPRLPGYGFFTGAGRMDHQEDFREAGTAVGYMIISVSMLASALHYLSIGNVVTHEMAAFETASGITLILISLILIFTAWSKSTPFLFLMIGTTMTMTSFITDIGFVLCVFMLLIGIVCFVRNDGKNMLGIAMIVYGLTYLLSENITGNNNGLISSVLNLIPFAIMVYLVFAYNSEKKLPIA